MKKEKNLKKFSPQFWLVIIFEFFERGSYYGMMSFISVYFTDTLNFPKESVGIIKGVIQPLLYFLPIISGAIADRFGYRRVLMVAFSLLGTGYFLTSQANEYGAVFAALVIMGIGAGTFKPIISGSIARLTDESNSSLGFGIYYWSINLGAFLFPLILVPFLKKMNPAYVIMASAIATASMLIPTALFFKDPIKKEKSEKRNRTSMIQTLANAFEIIYSPIILLYKSLKAQNKKRYIIIGLILVLFIYSLIIYLKPTKASISLSKTGIRVNNKLVIFKLDRNMLNKKFYLIKSYKKDFELIDDQTTNMKIAPMDVVKITIFKPDKINQFYKELFLKLKKESLTFKKENFKSELTDIINLLKRGIKISITEESDFKMDYKFSYNHKNDITIHFKDGLEAKKVLNKISFYDNSPFNMEMISYKDDIIKLLDSHKLKNFFPLYVILLIIIGLMILLIRDFRVKASFIQKGFPYIITFLGFSLVFIPGLSTVGRIVSIIIYFTIFSLFLIDSKEKEKFIDHSRFLLMILIYSGFWVLYFQMFDSVLWYVQSYVDATSLNRIINGFLNSIGIRINWFFDVEHVTVINAGTIIALQLIISKIVSKKKALPTMMFGIGIATIGMAMLSISTNIWIFIIGIILFSVGEMTAHPKFISYVGLTAPEDKKAMYMGYLFLYGVFGSSIGGIVGAKLYVHFVDNLNQPSTLWLIFSGIGVITILGLFLFNKFSIKKNN